MSMIERAALAIAVTHGADPDGRGPERRHVVEGEGGITQIITDHMGPLWKMWETDARAALLAALDPEDEALVEAVGRSIADECGLWSEGRARAAIVALRTMAQGGQT